MEVDYYASNANEELNEVQVGLDEQFTTTHNIRTFNAAERGYNTGEFVSILI